MVTLIAPALEELAQQLKSDWHQRLETGRRELERKSVMNSAANQIKTDAQFAVSSLKTVSFSIGEVAMSSLFTASNDTSLVASYQAPVEKDRSFDFAAKRVFDFSVALTLIILLSPVLLAVVAAVALTSKGSVVFVQRRWGRGNMPISVYKFRSMFTDKGDVSGVAHTTKNDPRVTAVGRFIRRTSLDELPQLFNVLKGDMSLVGPRAHAMGMHAAGVRYEDLVPEYFARHAVRPGMTGLAQIRGFRGEVTDAEHARKRVACDLEYIRNFSIWADLKIMILTIPAVLIGKGAY